MQLRSYKIFFSDVLKEARRLERSDIAGKSIKQRKFTDTQIISLLLSCLSFVLLKHGFTDNFAEYTIAFLGIFIGLFTTLLITLFDKKDNIVLRFRESEDETEKARLIKAKNYFFQFTGLISYSILIALILTLLLLSVLLFPATKINLWHLKFVNSITLFSVILFIKAGLIIVSRFLTAYLLCRFLALTLYALSSFFSFLLSEYRQIRLKPRQDREIV